MSAITFIKMIVFLLRLATGKNDHLPVIRAAWLGRYLRAIGSVSIFRSFSPGCLAGVTAMMAARTRCLVMFRMNVIACRASNDRSHITFPAAAACVHIKAYDTQGVPYHQQYRCQACEEILHTDLQRYKIPAKFHNSLCRPRNRAFSWTGARFLICCP